MRVVVVGDCLLDIGVAHAPPAPGGDRPARIAIHPGGQAANVAVRLARRGLDVALIAALGDDPAGQVLREYLAGDGVRIRALPSQRTGSVVILLDTDGERTMLSDRVPIPADGLRAALTDLLPDAAWCHVSGYALRDPVGPELASVVAARAERRSLDGGSVTTEEAASFRERMARMAPDLLVLNRGEAQALAAAGDPDLGRLTEALAGLAALVVVTGGAEGAAAAHAGRVMHQPAPRLGGTAVDTTGAGDAFSAVLIAELLADAWPPETTSLRSAMAAAADFGGRVTRAAGAQARIDDEGSGR